LAEAAGLEAVDFDRLHGWAAAAGARWGLDAKHLLASAPLAEAAGLEAVDFDRLHGWAAAAGARWGLDAKH
ncbi:hypothetical protein C7E13_22030, partial [Stenotrophomonas maltophilia]